MTTAHLSRNQLLRIVLSRAIGAVVVVFAMFFIPAGTLDYWQAWLFCALLFIPMALIFAYLLKNNPELLERRMRLRETHRQQKRIILLSYPFFVLVFLMPGLDRRFGWSEVPTAVVIVADVVMVSGYFLFFLVMRENSYASRVIEVAQGQKVISTGPYALIRHPLYAGALMMYVAMPLALGSFWAVIPALAIVPLIVARIINEESVLEKELDGYAKYTRRVRYRLIPGIW